MFIKLQATYCIAKEWNMADENQTSVNDQDLKTYVTSNKDEGLVFSYDIDQSFYHQEICVHLKQQETEFFLFIKIEKNVNQLLIKSFTLTDNKQLKILSSRLYEAAVVEIILQALDLVFFIAAQQKAAEALFILTPAEADKLLSLDGYFTISSSPLSSHKNIPVKLSFPTTTDDYDVFIEKRDTNKIQIRLGLWKGQLADCYLRNYLQQKETVTPFSLKNLIFKENKTAKTGQIIIFPKVFAQH